MNTKYLISVIVPCWNTGERITGLLDSILLQGKVDDVEVILVDDASPDPSWKEIAKEYSSKLNLVFTETSTTVHCPGNTRQKGLETATGEWLLFIDDDDLFDSNAFNILRKSFIEDVDKHHNSVIWTYFHAWIPETEQYGRIYDNIVWLHGNAYNHKFLIDNDIHFLKDLVSNEDGYFNCHCQTIINLTYGNLEGEGEKFDGMFWLPKEINIYKWTYRIDSLSRSAMFDKNLSMYMDRYLEEYLIGCSESWMWWYKKYGTYRDYCLICCINVLIMGYFYYEAVLSQEPDDKKEKPDRLRYLRNLWYKMEDTFSCTKADAIFHIYRNPDAYIQNKAVATDAVHGNFIELHSWKYFVENLL